MFWSVRTSGAMGLITERRYRRHTGLVCGPPSGLAGLEGEHLPGPLVRVLALQCQTSHHRCPGMYKRAISLGFEGLTGMPDYTEEGTRWLC